MAAQIERLLPVGVRPRQLTTRTLLIGMTLAMLTGRAALLRAIHTTLLELPTAEKQRLGVLARWRDGEHQLSYRQLEYTYRLICRTLAKEQPDGSPSPTLAEILDQLLEASVQVLGEPSSRSYAVDWTAQETWARPPRTRVRDARHQQPLTSEQTPDHTPAPAQPDDHEQEQEQEQRESADREAGFGHRTTNHPSQNEIFFGYYLQALTTVTDEHGPQVPELVRRIHLASPQHDPPAAIVPVIKRMHDHGIPIGDLLADSGYSYRVAQDWALPIRTLGIELIVDLHPNDRGPKGTHNGAIITNGNLYCPATPTKLLELSPLPPSATTAQTETHERLCHELARYKLAPLTTPDSDGYHRVICPATHGKLRCPHRPASLTQPHDRPTILTAAAHPPVCCTQQTITVHPPSTPKPPKRTTTPPPSTAAPTLGARPPSAPSRPSATAPPTTSPAAGAESWDSPPSRYSPRPPSSPATSASTTPSPPAKPTTTAAPPTDYRPNAAAAARASTTSPPPTRRPKHGKPRPDKPPRPPTHNPNSATAHAATQPDPQPPHTQAQTIQPHHRHAFGPDETTHNHQRYRTGFRPTQT